MSAVDHDDVEFHGDDDGEDFDFVSIGNTEDWAFLTTKFVQACDGVALVHKDSPTSTQYAIRFSLLDAEKTPHNVYFQFLSDQDASSSLEFTGAFGVDGGGEIEDAALENDAKLQENVDVITDRMDEMIRMRNNYQRTATSEHVARYIFEEQFSSTQDSAASESASVKAELDRRKSSIWTVQSLSNMLRDFLTQMKNTNNELAILVSVLDPENKLKL